MQSALFLLSAMNLYACQGLFNFLKIVCGHFSSLKDFIPAVKTVHLIGIITESEEYQIIAILRIYKWVFYKLHFH